MLRLHGAMHELLRTNDLVLLGAIEALLTSANIDSLITDQHMSALEGMTGAFQRRLLVREADRMRARALLIEAGFGGELRDG
ncbi:putative signal transducing protein [Bosea sp. BK604]|nr:putative signal transducing protein [Bosea sp. BK604]